MVCTAMSEMSLRHGAMLTGLRGGRSICSFSPPLALSSLFILLLRRSMIGDMFSEGGGMLPSPTILRNVSGIRLDHKRDSAIMQGKGIPTR